MYFKIEHGTELFKEFESLNERRHKAHDAAFKLQKSLGGLGYTRPYGSLGGGINAIKFEDKPDGFKSINKSMSLYSPKKSNKEMIKRIENLPIVTEDELNSMLGFEPQFSGKYYHNLPGFIECEKYILVDVSDLCKYTPKSDMIEILSSEYKELSKSE